MTAWARVSYDYTYTGKNLETREVGIKALLRPDYDEVKWRRWSEWGVFPKDSHQPDRRAAPRRAAIKNGRSSLRTCRPAWPWSQDQTELGTADFRSIKFNIYERLARGP